jgi:hypothetical protein
MLENLTRATFIPCLGSTFRILAGPAAAVVVELIEATALPDRARRDGEPPRREPFALLFRGPPEPVLRQRIYRLEHDALGAFDLFLVPIGPDRSGMRYEAIFN